MVQRGVEVHLLGLRSFHLGTREESTPLLLCGAVETIEIPLLDLRKISLCAIDAYRRECHLDQQLLALRNIELGNIAQSLFALERRQNRAMQEWATKLNHIEVGLACPHLILGHTHQCLRIFPMRLALADVGVESLGFEGWSVLQIDEQTTLSIIVVPHLVECHTL